MKTVFSIVLAVLVLVVATRAQSDTITASELLAGLNSEDRWLTFSGDYSGQRHSPLRQITPFNVSELKERWVFDSKLPIAGRGTESTPLFFDRRLYVTGL